jgi:PAS domain S-box-containing protein
MSSTTTPSGSFWEAEEFLSSLVSSSDVAIVGLTPQGTVASWNGAAEDLFGYRAEEMLGRDTELLCPPDRRDELLGMLERVRNGETVQSVRTERLRRNGTPVTVSLTLAPVTEPGASLRRSERTAVEALTLLETLQENAPVGIGFLDREYRIVRLNPMLAALDPSPARDHVGLLAAQVIPTMWPEVEPLFRRVLETGQAIVKTELYV